MKKDNCKKYQSVFNGWNKNRIAVETFLMSMDEPYIYVPKEGEEFRQCYLSDRKANRSQKFYKARHEMPKNWWVSNYGTILTVEGNDIKGYSVVLYLGQFTSTNRLQVKIKGKAYARETIVGLVFADKIPFIDLGVAEIIERKGLSAFRKIKGKNVETQGIELHHQEGYQKSLNVKEALDNLIENCNPKHIRFLQSSMHKMLTIIGDHNERLYKGETRVVDLQAISKAASTVKMSEPFAYIPGEKKYTGDVVTVNTLKYEDGKTTDLYTFVNEWIQGKRNGEGMKSMIPIPMVVTLLNDTQQRLE